MIQVIFTVKDNDIRGFEISGHSDYSEQGSDIVFAAVSSAALMAANTVTEIQSLAAEITEDDGFLSLSLSQEDAKTAEVVLNGLALHLNALSQAYSQYINVKIMEV